MPAMGSQAAAVLAIPDAIEQLERLDREFLTRRDLERLFGVSKVRAAALMTAFGAGRTGHILTLPHAELLRQFRRHRRRGAFRTRELYLQNPAIWLVKKSSLRAGHWAAFRELHRDTLAQSIDLEDLQPFGGGDATRCCLLLERRPMADTASAKQLRAVPRTGAAFAHRHRN